MRDTPPEVMRIMAEMIQKKTPHERIKMGWSMYETSRSLVIQAILRENPNISPPELRRELFLKFYRNDFDPKTREEIIKHLMEKTDNNSTDF